MATVRKIKRGGVETLAYLPVNLSKHPWRELGSILSLAGSDRQGGPFALSRIRSVKAKKFDVWTGGMAADKAKLLDMAEWTFSLPQEMLDTFPLGVYRQGVAMADSGSLALRRSVKAYAQFVNGDLIWMQDAQQAYWSQLDKQCAVLADCVMSDAANALLSEWCPLVHAAMRTAYARACPHETPRQIEAYAQGWKIIEAWKDKPE